MESRTVIVGAILAFAASALLSQISFRGDARAPAIVASQEPRAAASGPSYAALLHDLDQRIDGLQRRAEGRSNDWLTRAHLAGALLERASLTNQVRDYDRVQAVLDDAFAIAVEGSGPVLVAARFNFSIHRLAAAEKYLDIIAARAVPRGDDVVAARLLRAEIAVQRGQYDGVLAELTTLAVGAPQVAAPELALYHAKTGDPKRAEALLTEALAATGANDPRRRAWILLQLGIIAMDHGELVVALERLKAADGELGGWWLVQEHIAELHHRRGHHDKAIAILEELVRTADLPQHMDALASLYRHTGRAQEAVELILRAGDRWAQQIARFPESAMGHGLQHELEFGAPERALELALANVAARPGGDAQVALARVYLQLGRNAEALAVAEQVLATPYRTARLHDVAAKAHAALGHTAAAEEQTALCLAINPSYTSDEHSH
ncbi:MAG: tetratricopeptide repeat protein [Myxococcales bacterium]|nr:tetratricopeptide repeat protein [Myxococcales bacterium]